MPKVKYSEINDIIHICKETLQTVYNAEKTCKKARTTLNKELDKLYDIVLKQTDKGRSDGRKNNE